jgi:hypothetical protein
VFKNLYYYLKKKKRYYSSFSLERSFEIVNVGINEIKQVLKYPVAEAEVGAAFLEINGAEY